MEAVSVPTTIDGYDFNFGSRRGATQLVDVRKSSTNERFCGKMILSQKLPEFLPLEGTALKTLKSNPHPNILLPTAIVSSPVANGLIFPALGEDLHSYAKTKKGLSEKAARPLFRSIVSAVDHCHKNRIVLRDLRLGKIFFKSMSSSEVVLADLDGAQVVSHSSPFLSDRKGSPAFVSPEVVMSQSYDGAAADMWALGVILYILLTGTYPFRDSHPASLFQKIQQGHSAVFFPHSMSESAREIIRSLLTKEPHFRPSASQLLSDLWLSYSPMPSSSDHPDMFASPFAALSPASISSPQSSSSNSNKRCFTDNTMTTHSSANKRSRDSPTESVSGSISDGASSPTPYE